MYVLRGVGTMTKYTQQSLSARLYHECLAWKKSLYTGFHLEVYYRAEDDKVTFSGGMTSNNWTNDPEKIGILHYMTPSECLEYARQLIARIEKEENALKQMELEQ